ncbi:dATP pyrophosphohydrolase [Hyphococcus sp.]|uniref:dATP pyrophosphohydrolase n=1 Tax=Hyphococcus sp. TaxID=2038636 RepID=UPI003CCBD751
MTSPLAKPSIEIRPANSSAERRTFIRLAKDIYKDDPNFIAPLEFEIGARLNPAKNPTIKHCDHQLWIAYKDGAPAGRISAIVNKAHLDRHGDGAGHFGFFECVNDLEIARALVETASDWLKQRGMAKIAGPYNFSVNEEMGMLVDGFETPPYIMMPHGRRYYPQLLEQLGFTKAADVYAFSYTPQDGFIPEKRKRFMDKALAKSNVTFRLLNMSDFKADIFRVVEIFNDAWFDNWGFVPFTNEQIEHMAKELRPIISPHNVVFCYYEGEPVAFGLVLPDVNHAIRDFDGALLPFNWAKLLWRLKVKGVPRARMPLMGVVRRLHRRPVGTALAYKIIDMVRTANMERGVTHSELSWILESNESMVSMLLDLGSKIYKTYRIYEKPL